MKRGWIEERRGIAGVTLRVRYWRPDERGELEPASRSFRERDFGGLRKCREAADAFLATVSTDVRRGEFVAPSPVTLRELLERWQSSKEGIVSGNTLRARDGLIRYLPPEFAAKPIQHIRPMHLQALYGDLRAARIGNATITQLHKMLSGAFNQAVKWELVIKSPVKSVVAPRPTASTPRYWAPDDAARFVQSLSVDGWSGTLFRLLALTGMRRGEALALEWRDVDFVRTTISIRRTLSRDRAGHTVVSSTTKTPGSRRTIPIPPSCLEPLRRHKTRQRELQLAAAAWPTDHGDLVFTTRAGGLIYSAQIWRGFREAITAAGLPVINIHGLRHGFVTGLLVSGVSPSIVAILVGDTVTTVMRVYSQVLEGSRETAVTAFDELLSGSPGTASNATTSG